MDIQPLTDYLLQFRMYIEWGASISGITAVYLYGEKSNVAPYFGLPCSSCMANANNYDANLGNLNI